MKQISILLILSGLMLLISCVKTETMSDIKPVKPKQLYDVLDEADKIIVTEEPFEDSKILFESSDKKDIISLKNSISIKRKPFVISHCMCSGSPAIYIYKDGELLTQLTNHHGYKIRLSIWTSDAEIKDVEKWLSWFDERNMPGPRNEMEEANAFHEQSELEFNKWLAAMPEPIRPLWSKTRKVMGQAEADPLLKALRQKVPDGKQQILMLLEWFGSGAGPWSPCPTYEFTPEEMLLHYETIDIVSAIESTELTEAQLEGAARFFAGWDFSQQRPNGLNEVPDSIKEMLWNHVKDTKDEDKLMRAKRAFNK
jgi:hypothetical protein